MEEKKDHTCNILLVGPRERMYDNLYLGVWGVMLENRYLDKVGVEYIYPEDYIDENFWDGLDVVIDISGWSLWDIEYQESEYRKILSGARMNVRSVYQKDSKESAFEYLSRIINDLDLVIWGDRNDEGVKH